MVAGADDAAGAVADELGADELGAEALGADELGAEALGADELGAEALGADELGGGARSRRARGVRARGRRGRGVRARGRRARARSALAAAATGVLPRERIDVLVVPRALRRRDGRRTGEHEERREKGEDAHRGPA